LLVPTIANRRNFVTSADKDYLFAALVHLPGLFALAKPLISSTDFGPDDGRYAIMWNALVEIAKQSPTGVLPTGEVMKLSLGRELASAFEKNKSPMCDRHKEEIESKGGLLSRICDISSSGLTEHDGRRILMELLSECKVVNPLKKMIISLQGSSVDIGPVLKDFQEKQQHISGIGKSISVLGNTPYDFMAANPPCTPTGVDFLDEFMDGGVLKGEMIVVVAPTGLGKTTLGIQLAVEGAQREYGKVLAGDPDAGYWYYFSYESHLAPEIWNRVYSYAAYIHRDKLWLKKGDLSTAGNLDIQEKARYAQMINAGQSVPGERERLQSFIDTYASRLVLVDMSGTYEGVGVGGVDELTAFFAAEKAAGRKPAGYIIDYADIMITREIESSPNMRKDQWWYESSRIVDRCRTKISQPTGAVGYILQQANSKSLGRDYTSPGGLDSARGSGGFGHNANFFFVFGNRDEESNCVFVAMKKQRRAAPKPQKLVHINGVYCRFDMAGVHNYKFDAMTGKVVDKDTDDRVLKAGQIDTSRFDDVSSKKKKPLPDEKTISCKG
jgi:hypothetical protein